MKDKTITWLELAENDLEFAQNILKSGNRPHYSAHFCHQAVEKILKAIVQEHTTEDPRRTHNFKQLCIQAGLELTPRMEEILVKLSPHYMSSRYPEDMKLLYKQYTMDSVQLLLNDTMEVFEWLKKYLISKI